MFVLHETVGLVTQGRAARQLPVAAVKETEQKPQKRSIDIQDGFKEWNTEKSDITY